MIYGNTMSQSPPCLLMAAAEHIALCCLPLFSLNSESRFCCPLQFPKLLARLCHCNKHQCQPRDWFLCCPHARREEGKERSRAETDSNVQAAPWGIASSVQPGQKVTAQPVLFWSYPFPKCPVLTTPGLSPCACQRKQRKPRSSLCLMAFLQPSMAAVFVGSVTPGGVGGKTSHPRGHCSS